MARLVPLPCKRFRFAGLTMASAATLVMSLRIIKKGMVVPPSHGFLHPITSGKAVPGRYRFSGGTEITVQAFPLQKSFCAQKVSPATIRAPAHTL